MDLEDALKKAGASVKLDQNMEKEVKKKQEWNNKNSEIDYNNPEYDIWRFNSAGGFRTTEIEMEFCKNRGPTFT